MIFAAELLIHLANHWHETLGIVLIALGLTIQRRGELRRRRARKDSNK